MRAQWSNNVHVEGYIFNLGNDQRRGLQRKVTGPNSKNPGQEYIQGEMNIATDADATNVVTVYFQYVTPVWKSGKENTTYTLLSDLIDGVDTYEDCGTQAQKVRIDGRVAVNDFYTRDGELASPKRIEGSFIHKMNPGDQLSAHPATFDADMVVSSVIEREVENGDDYAEVKGYIFNFRNDALPVSFNIRNPRGVEYFLGVETPMVTNVSGDITSAIIKSERTVECDFGEPQVDIVSRSIRSWDISRAAKGDFEWDDEDTITKAELKKALADREVMLAEMKKRQEEWQNSQSGKAGFPDAKPAKAAVVEDDDDDDFQF